MTAGWPVFRPRVTLKREFCPSAWEYGHGRRGQDRAPSYRAPRRRVRRRARDRRVARDRPPRRHAPPARRNDPGDRRGARNYRGSGLSRAELFLRPPRRYSRAHSPGRTSAWPIPAALKNFSSAWTWTATSRLGWPTGESMNGSMQTRQPETSAEFYAKAGHLPASEAEWADQQATFRRWRADSRFE